MTHITLICVTLYLHRCQAHRGLVLHPVASHVMRFWLWLTTGMRTREWVAVHRKHHGQTDQDGDPHSPVVFGVWRVLLGGAWLYHQAASNSHVVEQWGKGTPNDWIERNLYGPCSNLGIVLLLILDLLLFGPWGLAVWAVQMLWVPFWAAGVINGLAHWWGYRNVDTPDSSRNLVPIAFWIGGEELHNSHHSDAANPKFSQKWWEFDIGWFYIKILCLLNLAKLRKK